jgi:beta-glucosidase
MGTQFPNGFLWGAATSAHQVEGGNVNSDWWQWEQGLVKKDHSGQACRHYDLYREDFDLAKSLHHNAHRFSVEWARIQPQEGEFSLKELEHYKEVVRALKERDIQPIVTLHHFTNPAWFALHGGWANNNSPDYFLSYVKKVIEALAGDVKYWVTINEPTILVYFSFIVGDWPPQEKSLLMAWKAMRNLRRAHVKAYRFIHKYYREKGLTAPLIGSANNLQFYQPYPDNPKNRFSAALRNRLFNLDFIKESIRSRSCDYIGINYYSRSLVDAKGWSLNSILSSNGQDDSGQIKKSSLGWDIYPEGLYNILLGLKKFKLPVIILENGISTDDDSLRWEFIRLHLLSVARALEDGVKVTGYMHWALIDNFEWDKGFGPHFGLIKVDYNDFRRTIKPSAYNFARVCQTSELI